MGRREKPLDPGRGAVQRFAYELRKLRDEAGTPTYRAMAQQAGYSGPTLSAAAAGERLPTPAVVRAYVVACGGDPEKWEGRWRRAVAEAGDARLSGGSDDEPAPYPGLARFSTGDGEHFHGRGDLIDDLVRLTGRARITAVVGASGSGKSSLLRAGLIPALRGIEGPAGGRVRDVADPVAAGDVQARPAAIRLFSPGAHPARAHEALFAPHSGPGDILLVIDQFEEVFTLCADPAERTRFLALLLTAAEPSARLRVVLAVRADFYGRCAEHGPLAEALRDSTLLVGPMTPTQLRQAVVRPAAARRIVVERSLTARIVADVTGEPGGLPLMAHALREVWRRRTGKTLTLAAYEAVGGVQAAVAHTAEAAYAACTPAEALAVRALLLRLVTPGDGTEDTRRPVDRTEFDADDTTARVLERFVHARLLIVDGDTVELAHEALISAWPRLHGWVDEDRDRLRLHRKLTEAARVWNELARDAGALYRGIRLAEAREAFGNGDGERTGAGASGPPAGGVPGGGEPGARCGELSRLERDFLAASVTEHEQSRRAAARSTRRLRTLTVGLAVLLCLAVVAGVSAWRQSDVSVRQREEAEARRAATLSETLRATQPRTAMRLALAAWRTADLPETRQALRTAAAQNEQDAFVQPEDGGGALNPLTWLSRDGRILTTVVRDKAVQWDVRTHRRIRTVQRRGLSEGILDVSADGRWIAYREPGRAGLVVGGLADGSTRRLATGSWTDTNAAFGPSGRTLVLRRLVPGSQHGRATLEVWDLRLQKAVMRYERGSDAGEMPVLSHDDRHLAWCEQNSERLQVLDVADRRPVAALAPAKTQRDLCEGHLTFTPDQRAVASGTSDAIVTWDFRTGRERPRLPLLGGAHSVRFSGPYALAWGAGAFSLWRTDLPAAADGTRAPLLTYPVASSQVSDIRLDPGAGVLRYQVGRRPSTVRTLSLQGLTGRAWRERAASPRESASAGDSPLVAVEPTGRTGLTQQGTLVDASTGKQRTGNKSLEGEDSLTTGAFSPDGKHLATAGSEGRITLWDARTWRRITVLRAGASSAGIATLAFSGDGSLLAAGAPDGSVQVWETASPTQPAATLPVGDGPALGIEFTGSQGELRIATPHLDMRARAAAPDRAAVELCRRAAGGLAEAEWRRYFPSADYRDTCGP
ncbi:nSTAND1 domain-containing NTPase [Streptomyces sp. NBC_01304]|uniref:nSTAND1 domain-containing NTPase n=1 Tax=Streptomyces sp. NBC_01304 TaxID=2903818 RepID=UPI002E120CF5|nr:hypothetical protein OG430_01880 [Streptomyces sp. NBC_01304]